ncbi:MAG: hypothetical protein JWO31_30, partial [Phycisphaerales bacterium]|nr:hypothetical protein [Phycisphaerales bacterium]
MDSSPNDDRRQKLATLADDAARHAVLSDPDDLPGLSALHDALTGIRACADEASAGGAASGSGDGVGGLAAAAGRAVELIMLREVEDASAALAAVGKSVA